MTNDSSVCVFDIDCTVTGIIDGDDEVGDGEEERDVARGSMDGGENEGTEGTEGPPGTTSVSVVCPADIVCGIPLWIRTILGEVKVRLSYLISLFNEFFPMSQQTINIRLSLWISFHSFIPGFDLLNLTSHSVIRFDTSFGHFD